MAHTHPQGANNLEQQLHDEYSDRRSKGLEVTARWVLIRMRQLVQEHHGVAEFAREIHPSSSIRWHYSRRSVTSTSSYVHISQVFAAEGDRVANNGS